MRWIKLALCLLVAGCGDNLTPGFEVVTRVPKNQFAAGERIDARCAVLDSTGEPVVGPDGNALQDTTTLTIDYRHPDSFTTDDEGQVIAKRVGEATVRCAAPDLDLIDEDGQDITIVAGPAARVVTVLSNDTAIAGTPVGVSCIAFDAFENPVGEVEHTLAMTPMGSGTTITTDTVAANIIGEYEVTCVVPAAADVVPDQLFVLAALPASLIGSLVPERSLYAIDEQVTLVAEAHDQFGNRVDDAGFAYASSPTVPSPSDARFRFDTDGTFFLSANVTSPTFMDIPLSVTLPVNVDSAGPAIQCMQINAQSTASEAYMVQLGPSTVAFPARIDDAFGTTRSVSRA
jgi:hypothetical protein